MQKSFDTNQKKLYIVSTPIGNLSDMTYRAVDVLNMVDVILAEDTRNSGVLLKHYHIETSMLSYHEFNKNEKENMILSMLHEGKNIALISDAGTPGISDPGYEIIKSAIDNGFDVIPIPGASAILAALVSSGLIIQPFTFIGFLPRKSSEAKSLLSTYTNRKETLVIYESPLRIDKTNRMLHEILGNRNVSYARELTKKFETIYRLNLEQAIHQTFDQRGEYVIVIEGNFQEEHFEISIFDHVKQYIDMGYDEKDAMKQVAKDRKITKSEVYKVFKIEH
ncbi:MAG: 16S rRNA (cytidine(1402)-2'-O)-methyltransferase [Acholeplasmataceae bacterium]|nr:16S rRNA (cytidine(1402)-2'-O)-methyltransferase [Acholeplasmataceae bacterium]